MSMLSVGDSLELLREVDAFLIPQGTPVKLPEGQVILITQALGGSYTVHVQGNLFRIHSKDADALGIETAEDKANKPYLPDFRVEEEDVWAKCQTCYDPEIPVNVADLGLIYTIKIRRNEENHKVNIDIDMTLTAPGCGMGPILVQDVHDAVMTIPNVEFVQVELVFDPPWNQTMMTEAAQLQLGLL